MLKGLRKKASILLLTSQTLNLSEISNDSHSFDKILKQVHDFEIALQAMDYLLDDRTPQGTDLLIAESKRHKKAQTDQPAAIFPLALGVMEFIEATLGFEPEIMAKAHSTLTEAESASLNNSKYNLKHSLATSHIYPPGTEFQVTYAELTLLNALVMLLTENNGMVESAKALFKLRRAYQTLDSVYKRIKELEPLFNKNLAKFRKEANSKNISTVDLPGFNSNASSTASLPQDLKLIKELEKVYQMRKRRVEGSSLSDNQNCNLFKSTSLLALSKNLQVYDSMTPMRPVSPNPQFIHQNSKFLNEESSLNPNKKLNLDEVENEIQDKNGGDDVENEDEDDELFSDALETPQPSFFNDSASSIPDPSLSGTTEASIISNTDSNFSDSPGNDTHLHVSTIDEFIHSGVQLCFGILQLVLSLIPPAIGKVLSIVGFKGDRTTGLKMLWRTAITSRNIHGELALLCLLVFYDGPVQFIDVGFQLPDNHDSNVKSILNIENLSSINDGDVETILKNPNLYTPQLLKKARNFFPHNALWLLQESRILASQGRLDEASKLVQDFTDDPTTEIQMQQVKSLLIFDRAMLYSFKHEFDEAARDFIDLVEISSWTRGLYLFLAGSCYLAKYRMIKMGLVKVDEAERQELLDKYEKLAEHNFKEAPTYVPGHGVNATNKKGGIGGGNKQMPFDKFLLRKFRHIEAVRKEHPKLSFIECVGTSPIHELIYFWNGYNRMNQEHLDLTYRILGYTGAKNTPGSANDDITSYLSIPETKDEGMIRYFLQSIALRQLGKVKEGLSLLDSYVISKYVTNDSLVGFKFTKLTYSPYLYPTALYEKTMFKWILQTSVPKFSVEHATTESLSWLKRAQLVSDIGDYELSNRTNMRIKAAGDRLEQLAHEAA